MACARRLRSDLTHPATYKRPPEDACASRRFGLGRTPAPAGYAVPGISVLEGRVLGHGHDEGADRPYLLLEGVDERIHLLQQSPEIMEARRNGKFRVNSFVRIQKYSAGARPFVSVQDLGNSWKLLQNDDYFRHAATRLIRNGVQHVDCCWGGWLGAYQKKLSTEVIAMRDHEHLHQRARGRAGDD